MEASEEGAGAVLAAAETAVAPAAEKEVAAVATVQVQEVALAARADSVPNRGQTGTVEVVAVAKSLEAAACQSGRVASTCTQTALGAAARCRPSR